ncbi:MAG: alpha/beta hydrolase [Clostridia bacterium]|nr:alpha/beta hydrolase [Clostridia bacterium]
MAKIYNIGKDYFFEGDMVFVYIGIVTTLLILLGSLFGYFRAFYSPKKREIIHGQVPDSEQYNNAREHIKELIGYVSELKYREVSIKAYDGITLKGKYYHTKEGAPMQILFHGYKGSPMRDFCGGLLLALKSGFNVIMVDQRAHGKSEGRTISFGIRERYDVLSWVKFANKEFGSYPTVLTGISMGASTVLMASDLKMPDNVVGIIADCPYSSPGEIIRQFCKNMGLPPKVVYPFAYLGALIYGGFILNRTSACKAVQNTNIPVLIFHGESDSIVPCRMSEKIYNACKSENKFLHTFKGADHGMSYMTDNEKYESAYNDFVSLCIDKINKNIF